MWTKRNESGTILIMTLWILAILILLAVGIGFRASLDLKLTGYKIDELKCRLLAEAGIVLAKSRLLEDGTAEIDTLYECGFTLDEEEEISEIFEDIELKEGSFSILAFDEEDLFRPGIADEERRLNLNFATKEMLIDLFPGRITEALAENILAWRGDTSIPEHSSARDYSELPYELKGEPFESLEEILLVKDIGPEVFYGEDLDEDGKVDLDEKGLKDYVTVWGEGGKVNINTATQRTLEAIGFSDSADVLVAYRKGDDMSIEDTEDNRYFIKKEDVLNFLQSAEGGGIGAEEVARFTTILDNHIIYKSQVFRIISEGLSTDGKVRKTLTAIYQKQDDSGERLKLLSFHEN